MSVRDVNERTAPVHPIHGSADDSFAAELRGFGPEGWLAFLAIVFSGNIIFDNMIVVPVGAALALVWARLSRTPWREIGYVRPRSWARALAAGVALGSAMKILMKTIVMPLVGADPINRTYH